MHVVCGEVHEKRAVGVLLYVVNGVACYRVGDVLVLPQCLTSALHIPDASDAVHYRLVVSVRRAQVVAQLWMLARRRFALEVMVVVHVDWRRLVVVSHHAVLDNHAGHTVGSGRHDVVVVETYVSRRRRQRRIPVLLAGAVAQSQVPLAYGARSVALRAEHVGYGELLGLDNHRRIARRHVRARSAPRILAREQRVARRR